MLDLYKVTIDDGTGNVQRPADPTQPGTPGVDGTYKVTTPATPGAGGDTMPPGDININNGSNGSVGGSDVGLNPSLDVLISEIADLYNALGSVNWSLANRLNTLEAGGGGILGGWSDPALHTWQNINEGVATTNTFTGANYTVIHTGKPIVINASVRLSLNWYQLATSMSTDAFISAVLYIDNTLIGEFALEIPAQGFPSSGPLLSSNVGGVVGTNIPAIITAGPHTYRLDYNWAVSSAGEKVDNSVIFFSLDETVVVEQDTNSVVQFV